MTDADKPALTPFERFLRGGPVACALEITPPQRFLPGVLLRRARLLGDGIHAINVIQRPDRMSSLEASLFLRDRGFEPAWHMVARGRSFDDVAAELDRAAAGGIRQLLCILGDREGSVSKGSPTVRDLVRMAKEWLPDALVGATFNQYGDLRDRAYTNLFGKLDAGAVYVQTQPVFDSHSFFAATDRIRRERPDTAIVPMVMPLLELEALRIIESRLGVAVPDGFRLAVEAGQGAAWEAFDRLLDELIGSPGVQGLAVMTYEMDPPESTGRRLLEALRRAGAITDPGQPRDQQATRER